MVDYIDEEDDQLIELELAALRQAILKAEPIVLLDGRFEKMITSPISTIAIARELLARIPDMRLALSSLEAHAPV